MFEEINYQTINVRKILRTVRGSINKALFYLGAKIPHAYVDDLAKLSAGDLENYLSGRGNKIKDLMDLDIKIRNCDDILDNDLSKTDPRPTEKILEVIEAFKKEVPEADEVARLFSLENEIISGQFDSAELQQAIKNLIEIRPTDFFVLSEMAIRNFGTVLSKGEYEISLEFYKEFQRLRDLLDDIMSIEEDIIKSNYNSIVTAKNNNISYHFFEEIIREKFDHLDSLSGQLVDHPNKSIFISTIDFWKPEYDLLFKRLLIDYYINIDEFRASYFMIKQL
jgi:hypothetical protein